MQLCICGRRCTAFRPLPSWVWTQTRLLTTTSYFPSLSHDIRRRAIRAINRYRELVSNKKTPGTSDAVDHNNSINSIKYLVLGSSTQRSLHENTLQFQGEYRRPISFSTQQGWHNVLSIDGDTAWSYCILSHSAHEYAAHPTHSKLEDTRNRTSSISLSLRRRIYDAC